jgi:signal transduction histidine kinase
VTLRADTPVRGYWDPARIGQVIANLLTNAMKYGRGRPITIAVTAEGSTAHLIVRDQGIGIAPEHLDRIFGRFERAVAPGQYSGMGMGLYITREIVEAHGGTITVTSALEQGATFTVTLPRVPD